MSASEACVCVCVCVCVHEVCSCHSQKLLCERLEEQLQNLDTALKKKERAERRCRCTHVSSAHESSSMTSGLM